MLQSNQFEKIDNLDIQLYILCTGYKLEAKERLPMGLRKWDLETLCNVGECRYTSNNGGHHVTVIFQLVW